METEPAAAVLLVRAIEADEEIEASPDAAMQALEAAGEFDDERSWFARRAGFLLDGPFRAYRPLLGLRQVLEPRAALGFGLPLLAGLLSNYLGPERRIHVLYNPIAFLLVWNGVVYLAGGIRALGSRRPRAVAPAPGDAGAPAPEMPAPAASRPRAPGPVAWILRRSAARLWLRAHRATAESREQARAFARVGQRFWQLWDSAARPIYAVAGQRVLHLAAAGLACGAVAGMYVRGLFLDYHVVWRSTFVHDPETVAALVGALLGPAALLTSGQLPSAADARALLTAEGVGAAGWIGLYAVSTALFVVLPRLALFAWAGRRLRRMGGELDLEFGAPYYVGLLARARAIRVGRVRDEIQTEVRVECVKFAEAVAVFVTERLFDGRIEPRVLHFREHGGSVAELEAEIRRECEAFGDELAAFLARAQKDFDASLSRAILAKIGRSLSLPAESGERLGSAGRAIPSDSVTAVGRSLSDELAWPVEAAVTAAVATFAGTVSGGFGHSMGLAIVAVLLKTTGPVGFLIGALAGALAAVSALWMGRERLREGVKRLQVPGWLARRVLGAERTRRLLAEGRSSCRDAVRELMSSSLDRTAAELAEQIWSRVRPLLAEPPPDAPPPR